MRIEPERRFSDGRLVFLACSWLAVTGGVAELLVLWMRKRQHPMLPLSADYGWSVPAALVTTVLVVALPWIAAGRRYRSAHAVALFLAGAVVALDLLLLVPRLAPYAAALLAAGIGAQIARLLLRNTRATQRAIRAGLPIAAVLAVLVSGAIWASSRFAGTQAAASPVSGPNVILITLDTVRAANLSLYGYARATTPNLVRYGLRGVVFDQAFSTAPWTLPSHASLMTGKWPHDLTTGYDTPLDGRFPTLAEQFSGFGYRTAGFVANLGYCGRDTGLARGFSQYEDYPRSLGQVASNSTLWRSVADNFTLRKFLQNDEHLNRVSASNINARVLNWIGTDGGTPFFAFLNYFDAHEPYLPPPPFDRMFGVSRQRGRHSPLHHAQWDPAGSSHELPADALQEEMDAYDDALAYLDQQVGALLDALSARQLIDRTLIIITADHGEEFAEHRVLEHGYSLYRPALQVPLMMILPARIPAGLRVSVPVSLRDVAATAIEIARGAPSTVIPGSSLSALWSGAGNVDTPILSELTRPPGDQPAWYPVQKGDMQSLVYQDVRYIRNGDGSEELYALNGDALERHDLAADPVYRARLLEARARLNTVLTAGR